MAESKQVVVIGAGISGLSCAYRLRQLGLHCTLLETSARTGGLMGTVQKDGFLFESGPQSFQGTPLLMQLIGELKLESELCKAPPRAPRYVLRHGRMQQIAMSPQALLASSLISVKSRWKIASEAFRRTKPPSEEESIAAFVRRKFGHEILEYLVSPFVSGVYAGDPEKMSLSAAFPSLEQWEREYGSIIRGAMKSRKTGDSGPPPLCSFRSGIETLPKALAASLDPNTRTSASAISISRDAGYAIRVGEDTLNAAAIVVAAPAYVSSHLLRGLSSQLADTLSGIAYASVAVYAAGYHAKQAASVPDGFGVLIPRSEKHRTLGIVWNSSLFPGRAQADHFTITSFLGGIMEARQGFAPISPGTRTCGEGAPRFGAQPARPVLIGELFGRAFDWQVRGTCLQNRRSCSRLFAFLIFLHSPLVSQSEPGIATLTCFPIATLLFGRFENQFGSGMGLPICIEGDKREVGRARVSL